MVILNSTPEDVNFYQMNMIHDVGHDYFGNGSRVKKFADMEKMVDAYLSDFKIQSGGARTVATERKRILLGIEREDKSANIKKLRKRLETIDFAEKGSFSEYMEKNIRPMLKDVFYQLHFYYYTLKFNMETLKFDKYVSESVFGNELKSVDNSVHDNMYNKFVMLCWNLFNNNISNLENYKNLTSQDLVDKDNWARFWKYLQRRTQYGGVNGDFECTPKGDFSFTISPLSKDGKKFTKSKTVTFAFDGTNYNFSATDVKPVGKSKDSDGIKAWIQKNVTNSVINKKGDSNDIQANKTKINACITKEVERIVGNLDNLPSASTSPSVPVPPTPGPSTPAPSSTPVPLDSKKTAPKQVGVRPKRARREIPPTPLPFDASHSSDDTTSTTTTDDTSSSDSTVTSNVFIMTVMAWFYQNFIGDYGDTMNHFLRAESDVFELFKSTRISKWTEQDENIMRASQHIVSSHSKIITKDDLSNEDSMCDFRSKIRTLSNGSKANRYLVDNAGKEFHGSSGNAICSLSSMMDGITLEINAVECLPLKTLPLGGNAMTAPEIGNMAVYLQSVEKRLGTNYKRHVELERYFSDENNVVFKASFVGNGSNGKDQTFTSTMTMSKWDNNVDPKFSFKYDDNNLNITQDRLGIDPDLLFDNAVIVAGDLFHCATNSLINLEKDAEFTSWKNDVSAHREKIIARIVLSAYSCLIFKSFGDILQEWNSVLKGGGYVEYVKNNATGNLELNTDDSNHIWQTPYYVNDVMENERFTKSNLEPIRVIVCGDRPSATRVLWSLYNAKKRLDCNSDWSSWINSNCTGGYMYRELNPPTGIQTLGDEGSSVNESIFQPVNIGKFSVGITKSVKNYFMYNAGKEESYTFETSNFILDNALAVNDKNVSITFDNGIYTVSFGESTFKFNDIMYPGNTNELDRKPHPIVFNMISEWLIDNEIVIDGNFNSNDPVVTSMKEGTILCYRKRGIVLNNYYTKRLDKQIFEKNNALYAQNKTKIDTYLNGNNFICMMQSLSNRVPFTVYLLPNNFAKAYDENGLLVDSSVIDSDTIFTVENCNNATPIAKTPIVSKKRSRPQPQQPYSTPIAKTPSESIKRSRQQQVGSTPVAQTPSVSVQEDYETDTEVATINDLVLSPSKTPPLTPGSPFQTLNDNNFIQTQDEVTPMESQQREEVTPMVVDNNRVFTLKEIKDALKPVAGLAYDSTKKKFKDGMTLTQIKDVKLPKDVNEETKEAFYKKLEEISSSSMQGGAVDPVEENMNPLVYAVVSVGALVLALTGLQM